MRLALFIMIVLAAVGIACSSSVDLDATPSLDIGQDICEQCGMIISEEAYASAYRLNNGRQKLFDDIGDMVTYHRLHREDVYVFWVHDYSSLEWIRAENAYFVASTDLVTPMGGGIAAFADRAAAESMAVERNGVIHRFDGLTAQPIEKLQRQP